MIRKAATIILFSIWLSINFTVYSSLPKAYSGCDSACSFPNRNCIGEDRTELTTGGICVNASAGPRCLGFSPDILWTNYITRHSVEGGWNTSVVASPGVLCYSLLFPTNGAVLVDQYCFQYAGCQWGPFLSCTPCSWAAPAIPVYDPSCIQSTSGCDEE